jgi:Apea-like HEPN
MNAENLQQPFNDLVKVIQSLVQECTGKRAVGPNMMLMCQQTPLDCLKTETGVRVSRTNQQYLSKPSWFTATWQISEKAKGLPEYSIFQETLCAIAGKNIDHVLTQAVSVITGKLFAAESLNSSELLDYLLKAIANVPVPAWSDIDVYGVSIKDTPDLTFTLGNRRFVFRQLDVADYKWEYNVAIGAKPRFRIDRVPPSSVLKIEMNAWRHYELQIEASKMTAMLRLFRVCSVIFGRQTYSSLSPFTAMMGETSPPEIPFHVNHEITLTSESAKMLQQFWSLVEPNWLHKLQEQTPQKDTPISIAYERYCDSLLTNHPIERKISFAIMGLEAIYLGEKQTQELMYRLKLSVCKVLSKLDFENEEVRKHLKDGYQIRSEYVHGGRLSDGEKKKYEAKGITLDKLACKLLDYLRISLLHLIVSKQSKNEFLNLLEDSLIERNRDDELQTMMESEKIILKM